MKQRRKKLRKLLLCFALVVVMLTQSFAPVTYAKPDNKGKKEEAVEETIVEESEPERYILHEVEKNRGEYSKEYLLSDNSRSVIVYPDKIHFENEDGVLVEIDNSLTETEDGYENGNNSYDVLITDNEDCQGEVIYREDGYEITWQMVELKETSDADLTTEDMIPEAGIYKNDKDKTDKKTEKEKDKENKKNKGKKKVHKPKVSGKVTDIAQDIPMEDEGIHEVEQSKVVFEGYGNGVSVEYQPTGDGIKENIILSGKESGNEYVFEVKISGLGVRLNDYNEIEFYDEKTDEVKYYFPAPFMIDDNGNVSYDARYEIMVSEEEYEEGTEEASEETSEETSEENTEEASEETSEESTEEASEETSEESTEEASEETSEENTEEASEETSEERAEEISKKLSEESTEETSEESTEESTEEASEETSEESTEEASEETSEENTEEASEETSEENTEETSEETSEESTEDNSEESTEESTEAESEEEDVPAEDIVITEEADAVYIKIVLDEEWLSEAAYPVIVDPVLKQNRAKNLLDYGSVASNHTLYETLYVGKNSENIYRSFVKFDLPEMEPQSIVSEALLYLGGTYDSTNKHYIQAHMAQGEWYHKAEEQTGDLLSWDTQPEKGKLLDYTVYAGYFNITKAVRRWLSGEAANDGIVFSAYDETVNKRDTIKLKDSGSSPYLKITYRSAVGLEGYWGTHSTGAGTAGAGYINDYTGALTVQNIGVVTAGGRMPLQISHIYNSNVSEGGNGWHLNYEQTIKVPVDTADTSVYPYVYTDADGTEHYFKKGEVTYQENGSTKTRSSYLGVPAAKDEDGLKLYIVPVTNAELRDTYPLKLVDQSATVVKYFDTMGRLAMITDSNQHENGSNSATKEKNAIIITYESYGEKATYESFDEAIAAAESFYDTCRISGINTTKQEYVQALEELQNKMEVLKKDIYVTSDYKTAAEVNTALVALSSLADLTGTALMDTAKTNSKEIKNALTEAKTRALTLEDASSKRIAGVTDAVGNTAEITYNDNGQISSISDPSYAESKKNTYTYDADGNLTEILFANGKHAYYTYGSNHLMTSQRDHDGYQVKYTYRTADNRIVKVEESHTETSGQTFGITYNTDNTTTFRFSGVDDKYGNGDDVENIHVFDEQGRAICVYSKKVNEDKVIGAAACTYADTDSGTENTDKRNKIKDTAVVGMHTNNLLVNHSFEYSDSKWTLYKNESETPASGALSVRSTTRRYIGGHSAYINLTKVKNCTSGFKQSAELVAGTYTFSGYVRTVGIKNAEVYLKVKDGAGNEYRSNRIDWNTDTEFDNGWQRLEVTFTIDEAQTVTVYLEADCSAGTGAGNAAFDCVQLEEGMVANDYNILEDGSFELTEEVLPYQATNYTQSTVLKEDELSSGGIDGDSCYHITGQPGKDKFLKLRANLGVGKGSYVLSGWFKTDTTPIRSGRDFKVYAYYKDESDEDVIRELSLSRNINAYSEGWRYFCMIIPADTWGNTTFTIRFFDNIGDLYIDGLSLTRNDVQTKKYNSEGKVVSSYTMQKSSAYKYDDYGRTKQQTSPLGLVNTYTFSKTNEITKITSNVGPEEYMKYDKYGNLLSKEIYDSEDTKKLTRYTETAYTSDGNFVKSEKDGLGSIKSYEYDTYTGLLLKTIYPERDGEEDLEIVYEYDEEDRLTLVTRNERTVGFEYGEFDDLTAILHNGFAYEYTYDKFGNMLSVSIAGNTLYTNEYAPNNGSLTKRTYIDGAYTTTIYDDYGRVTENGLNGVIINKYVYNNDGAVAKQTDLLGNETSVFHYNDSGQVVRSEIYTGDSTVSEDLESRMQFTYNSAGQPTVISCQEPGREVETYKFTYARDGRLTKSVLPDKSYKKVSYDSLRRPVTFIYAPTSNALGKKQLYSTITYLGDTVTTADGKSKKVTSSLVERYVNQFGSSGEAVSSFEYSYDDWNNIVKITDTAAEANDKSESVRTYEYNEYGEVTKAVETYANGQKDTYVYTYDNGGNILTETVNGTSHTYEYDSVWKDKLVSYDGKTITYDEYGQPLDYMGATCTWDVYGNLISYSKGEDEITYTYASDGRRKSKTVNGVTTTYSYHNGLLISEKTGDETLRYYYDSSGKVLSLGYIKGTAEEIKYFFTRNAQDDIVSIYRSSDSVLIGTYEYDLWGKPVSITEATPGIDTDGILEKNPYRYRSYRYDEETGFYHLKARYYDPEIRRFISADTVSVLTVETTSTGFKNLFAYCENNPIILNDSTGQEAIVIFGVAVGADLIFDFAGLALSYYDLLNNPTDPLAYAGVLFDFADIFLPGCYSGEVVNAGKYAIRAGSGIIAGLAVKYGDDAAGLVVKNADEFVEAGTDVIKLSKNNIQHINKHTFEGMAEQAKHLTDEQLANKLANTTFFNKNWSQDEVVKYTQEAYNILRSQGKTGLHSVEINGEIINVFIKDDGAFDTAYGIYQYTVDDFR